MKVLVTGGAGYIGSCTVEVLLDRGHEVVVLDTFNWGREALAPFADRITMIEGDCRNSKDVVYALEGADSVIHLAGIVGAPACTKNPLAHFTVNVEATRTLINCMTDREMDIVRDLIYCSSCSVYGNVKGLYEEVNEATPTNPLSEYADGKLRSENILLEKAAEVPHFHPTIIRLTTIFGWSHRPRLDLVTNLFAYKALTDGELTIFGDGSQYRSLIHVRDVARALVVAMEAPRWMRSGKIFHVGEEKNNKTLKEIAELVKAQIPEVKINFEKGADTDRRDYKINCQLIKNVLGWEAKYSVEDGIKDIIDNIKSSDLDWDADYLRNDRFDYK